MTSKEEWLFETKSLIDVQLTFEAPGEARWEPTGVATVSLWPKREDEIKTKPFFQHLILEDWPICQLYH